MVVRRGFSHANRAEGNTDSYRGAALAVKLSAILELSAMREDQRDYALALGRAPAAYGNRYGI